MRLRHTIIIAAAIVTVGPIAYATGQLLIGPGAQYTKTAANPCAAGQPCTWFDTSGVPHLETGASSQTIPSVPATTKGDVSAYSGTAWGRLPAGSNGQCLKADSTQTLGLAYGSCVASTGYSTIQDETIALTQRAIVNFTGSGIVCVDNGGATRTDCSIPATVTSVTCGTGLTGGAITAAGTCAVSTAQGQSMLPTDATYAYGGATNRLTTLGTQSVVSGTSALSLTSNMANAGVNTGPYTDTTTALTAGRSYFEARNGGTAQWSMWTAGSGEVTLEASAGSASQILGNGDLVVADSPSVNNFLQTNAATIALVGNVSNVGLYAATQVLAQSLDADSASAVALRVNSFYSWTNAAARALTLENNSVEKFAVLAASGDTLGNLYDTKVETLASAATIAPTKGLVHVTGTTTVSTITAIRTGSCVKLIADNAAGFSTTTGGNIAVATVVTQNRWIEECYDGTSWYPSL